MSTTRIWADSPSASATMVALAFVVGVCAINLVVLGQETRPRPAKVIKLFVSPDGDDSANGSQDAPLRTVARAQEILRQLRKSMAPKAQMTVILMPGTYFLDKPLEFGPQDSGEDEAPIVYQAWKPGSVIISGGKRVGGWQQTNVGLWEAPWKQKPFRQLYVNGKRGVRARSGTLGSGYDPSRWESLQEFSRGGNLPDADFAACEGYVSSAVEMAEWGNPQDLELVFVKTWSQMRYLVRELRREGDILLVLMKQPQFYHGRFKEGVTVQLPDWIENAYELLDEPGEWYLDRLAGKLFYLPRPGEELSQDEVIVPQLERILIVRGDLDNRVRNLVFRGIVFSHANWWYPSEVGHADVQANFTLDSTSDKVIFRRAGFLAVHNEYRKSPAAILLRYAENVCFENCSFTKLGSAGVDIEQGSRGNRLVGCHFFDISGTAVQIGDVQRDDHHPDDVRKIVADNSVENCLIHDCGLEYMGGVGIFVGYTTRTRIVHNEICRLPYTGISVGWGWGEEDAGGGPPYYWQPFRYQTPTPCRENYIAFNHIHHIMRPMEDGGGIYTLGNQPGTLIQGNYIHHAVGAPGGIYLDEGSGYIEVRENVVHDVHSPVFFNNHAQDRIATCTVENNFFFDTLPTEVPPQVEAIMARAGLNPEYRHLLQQVPGGSK